MSEPKKITTIGHVDHGKSVLTAALVMAVQAAQTVQTPQPLRPKRPHFDFDERNYRAAEEHLRKEEDWNADTLGVPRKKRGPL